MDISGYTIINREDFKKDPTYAKLILMYELDEVKFRSKFQMGYGIEVVSREDVRIIANAIETGKIKGFNMNSFLKSFKIKREDILKSKIKII